MRVFDVRTPSSSPRLPWCFCVKFRFFRGPVAELARGETSRTHSRRKSINRSPSLFGAPGTEAFALEQQQLYIMSCQTKF